jgi:hypothetical protein
MRRAGSSVERDRSGEDDSNEVSGSDLAQLDLARSHEAGEQHHR